MKLVKLILENFRGYKNRTEIDIVDFTVFVGKNDVGKSTILEALDIFFNDGQGTVKLDKDDLSKNCSAEDEILIGCIFDVSDMGIVIDDSYQTSLKKEYLLNRSGKLEILKRYKNGGKPKAFLVANHPTNEGFSDLLLKKQSELRAIVDTLKISDVDKTKNAEMRTAIWRAIPTLVLDEREIDISKEDAKKIAEKLWGYLPLFALFQADRKNSDGDSEVQDPMKLAVRKALSEPEIVDALEKVSSQVWQTLEDVANRTLEKLKEMNPAVADGLSVRLPLVKDLKWGDVFKSVSIIGTDEVPINKRGSGIRRLVLLNFFRVEADWLRENQQQRGVIYAIEEPETSQHLSHQRELIRALMCISNRESAQVLLTTHSPSVVKMLCFDNLRLIRDCENGGKKIETVSRANLPYPSLNEVNYSVFGEAVEEFHNELYGYIEENGWLDEFKENKDRRKYIRIKRNRERIQEEKILTEYIRHQIHHPENTENPKYTSLELKNSIDEMRKFISQKRN